MSYNRWIQYGFGITDKGIDTNVDSIFALIHMAPNFEDKYLKWLECTYRDKYPSVTLSEVVTKEEALAYENENYYIEGIGAILIGVMNELEEVEFYGCVDFDDETFVLYIPSYPWDMKDQDFCLTEGKIERIFDKYVSILTDKKIKPAYLQCHNGG